MNENLYCVIFVPKMYIKVTLKMYFEIEKIRNELNYSL